MWVMKFLQIGLLLGGFAALNGSPAHADNFHDTFEARCTACHGHAGTFARTSLRLRGGKVVGLNGSDLRAFLTVHQGGLSPEDVEIFLSVFEAQLKSAGFYQQRCKTCHDRAYEFARLNLIIRNGDLMGRYSGHDVRQFLLGHARMTQAEADEMYATLMTLRRGVR